MKKNKLLLILVLVCLLGLFQNQEVRAGELKGIGTSWETATTIEDGDSFSVSFSDTNRDRFVKFTLDSQRVINWYMYSDYGILVDFTVYNHQGDEILTFDGGDEISRFALSQGTYYVHMECKNFVNMDLLVFIGDVREFCEIENNDTFSKASYMEFDEWYPILTYDTYNDKDYFYFNVEEGDEIYIWVDEYEAADCPVIYMYGPDRREYTNISSLLSWDEEEELYCCGRRINISGKFYIYTYATNAEPYWINVVNATKRQKEGFWLFDDNNKAYWYENGVKQGTYDDPKGVLGDGTVRGREIYDPKSDGWYWLDAVYDGAKAVNKEVWMPYIYQDEAGWEQDEIKFNAEASGDMAEQVIREINNRTGKWVRYDENGKMYKGWYTVEGAQADIYPDQVGNTYFYDHRTGLMAKGEVEIDGVTYYFDPITGVLQW